MNNKKKIIKNKQTKYFHENHKIKFYILQNKIFMYIIFFINNYSR
jgi:hypothetical protein